MNRRGNNVSQNIFKNLKDYMVPIIAGFLIIIFLWSVFSGGSDEVTPGVNLENQIGLGLSLDSTNTQGSIVYLSGDKKDIESGDTLYKSEKVLVKEGTVSLELTSFGDLKLKKNGELKFEESGEISLFESDLWINSAGKITLNMKFAKVNIGANSTVSVSQNEVGSTIYLLTGYAEVTNNAGQATVLAAGQKITISNLDSNKDDIDLSLLKTNIDDYFKSTDWFIKNNGNFYLMNSSVSEKTNTGTVSKKSPSLNLITFNNLEDESQVSDSSIEISGRYTDETITSITLNGIEAILTPDKKTFIFDNVITDNKINDLVFKVIDDSGDVLEKMVYTVYYDGGASNTSSDGGFKVTTYDLDGGLFTFTEPSTGNSFTTYSDAQVTIKGRVDYKNIAEVRVNDYSLKSFNGITWRYHASSLNNNLKDGTNIYEVKYFDENGKVVYTNYYTIVKKVLGESSQVEEKDTKLISDEA